MDIYEEAVLNYITESPQRFVNPQYNIDYDKSSDTGGSLPDFITLDFKDRIIYIIEVTRSYNLKNLLIKVSEREKRWIQPVKNSIDESLQHWKFHTTLFIREDRIEYIKNKLSGEIDVSIISLKTVDFFLGNGSYANENCLINDDKKALPI